MKKTDIIEIAIKLLGLYLFVNVISTLKSAIESILFLFAYDSMPMDNSGKIIMVITSITGFLLMFSFATLLTFGSKTVTRKICNSSDYQENAKLFTDKKTLLEIAIIIIGGLLFTNALPDFIVMLFSYIQNVQMDVIVSKFDSRFIFTSFAKLIIGILLLYYNKALSGLLTKNGQNVKVN